MPTIYPVGDQVLVLAENQPKKSGGGIYIPDVAAKRPVLGVVAHVGRGRRLEHGGFNTPLVQPGDRVIFKPYGSSEVEIDGQAYLAMTENEIIAIVDRPKKD
jgi:chaperonin GroES